MSTYLSKGCTALLLIASGSCTVVTADSNDGGTSTGSAGTGGAAGTTTSTTSATTGTSGSTGAGGAATGAGGSSNDDGGTTPDGSGGGVGMTDAAVPNDPCNGGTETTPNEDRDSATPYPLGASAHACLQSSTDVDFYVFTLPMTPAQGGFIKVQVTDVGQQGNLDVHLFAAHDNGEFEASHNATAGGSVFFYFAGKAGATFRLKVNTYTGVDAPTAYTLTAAFNPVNDVNEPNDDNAQAKPITVGTAVNGYFFAGHEDSTPPAAAAWEDRFKVTLPAGDATIALTNIASDISGAVMLYNPLGSLIASAHDATSGSSVVLQHTVASADAGDCFIMVEPYFVGATHGVGSTVPVFWTMPYSLLVTTP